MALTVPGAESGAPGSRPQVGIRGVGILLGLKSRFGPFMTSPTLRGLMDMPFAPRIARLKSDAGLRQRIASEGMGGAEPA